MPLVAAWAGRAARSGMVAGELLFFVAGAGGGESEDFGCSG